METDFFVCEELAVSVILGSDFTDEFVKRIDVIPQKLVLVDGASARILRTVPTDLRPLSSQPTLLDGRSARSSQKVVGGSPDSTDVRVTLIQSKPDFCLKRRVSTSNGVRDAVEGSFPKC